jgi:hypothetical protein
MSYYDVNFEGHELEIDANVSLEDEGFGGTEFRGVYSFDSRPCWSCEILKIVVCKNDNARVVPLDKLSPEILDQLETMIIESVKEDIYEDV